MKLDEAINLQTKVSTEILGHSQAVLGLSQDIPYPVFIPNEIALAPILPVGGGDIFKREAIHHDLDYLTPFDADLTNNLWNAIDSRALLGTGVGYRGGSTEGGYTVKLFLQRKSERDRRLAQEAMKATDGAAEIIYTGAIKPLGSNIGATPPSSSTDLSIGQPAAHFLVKRGTLGGFVERNGELLILSNNHVLANQDHATTSDPIVSPCPQDGGTLHDPSHIIGEYRDAIALNFGAGATNLVDCAVAQPRETVGIDRFGLRFASSVGTLDPHAEVGIPDMPVQKIGMTTGHTQGRIDAVNVSVTVYFDLLFQRACHFSNQIRILGDNGRFSRGGDSGSLVFSANSRPVGLVFAGDSTAAYANPIQFVLGGLGCTF